MSLPIDRTAKSTLDTNLVNGNTSDAPVVKASNDVVYNTVDELNAKVDALVSASVLVPYPPSFLSRQSLINPNFDRWERNTSFSAAGYTADRWSRSSDGSGMVSTVSRQTFAPGQTEVPNEPAYFLRHQVTAAATSQTFNALVQYIESVRTFAGQKVTLSFWAKADTSRTLKIDFAQLFGSGGSASVQSSATNFSLTTVWQKFTISYTFPSIAGKTIGTNDCIWVEFTFPVNTTFTIDISQVQLCAGNVALPFQPKHPQEEKRLCEWYYEKQGNGLIGVVLNATTILVSLKYSKRTNPTINLLTTTPAITANGGFLSGTGSTISIYGAKDAYGALVTINGFTGLTVGQVVQINQADLVSIDAEF